MIFVWIRAALFFILRLFIPPLPEPAIPQLDINAPCPSCGHREGALTAVQKPDGSLHVRHDCKICKAKWFEQPVLRAHAASSATVLMTAGPAKE